MTSELEVLMDAEIAIDGLESHREQKRVTDLLKAMRGVEEPTLYGGLLVLRFDPLTAPKATIRDALDRAGFQVSWMKIAPASSITDGVHP